MCITSAPARLSSTTVFGNRAVLAGKRVHVLGYQNTAHNFSGQPNAMIIPIPSSVALGPDNMIDTRPFGRFMTDYAAALRPRERGVMRGGVDRSLGFLGEVQTFECGSYTVVLAHDADPTTIKAALDKLPAEKRPTIHEDLLASYERLYPGWHLAICCFNKDVSGEPLLWWFEPAFDNLFLPGLDAHDGGPPKLDVQVSIDHSLIVGVDEPRGRLAPDARASHVVRVSEPRGVTDTHRSLFPMQIAGQIDKRGTTFNGDWFADATGKIHRVSPVALRIDLQPSLVELLDRTRAHEMTPEEREAQRRSFAFGNSKMDNDTITRDDVDRAAERLAKR